MSFFSIFQQISTLYSPFVSVGNAQLTLFVYDSGSWAAVIRAHMSSAVFFLLRPTLAKQHYSSQCFWAMCYLQLHIGKCKIWKSIVNSYRHLFASIESLLLLTSGCDEWISHPFFCQHCRKNIWSCVKKEIRIESHAHLPASSWRGMLTLECW